MIRSIFRLNRRRRLRGRCRRRHRNVKNPNGDIFSVFFILVDVAAAGFRNLFLLTRSVLNITILFLFYAQIVIIFEANVTFGGMLRHFARDVCVRLLVRLLLAGWLVRCMHFEFRVNNKNRIKNGNDFELPCACNKKRSRLIASLLPLPSLAC